MKRFVMIFLMAIFVTSCAHLQSTKSLEQVKADLDCILWKKDIEYKQISDKFGSPDIAPLPEPGTGLGRNTRVYRNKTIIFYTELQEFKEGEKVRFHEVVTGIEVCKGK